MRTSGKITYWNTEKGYGFISPSSGAKQVFVHIRAFQNKFWQPGINQDVTFELSVDRQGRPCAKDVAGAGEALQRPTRPEGTRPAEVRRRSVRRRERRPSGLRSGISNALGLLIVLGFLGLYVYPRIHEFFLRSNLTTTPVLSPYQETPPSFECDGRTYCSEMTSCEEATYFIRNCPGTKMDGDLDGVPCERQWCG